MYVRKTADGDKCAFLNASRKNRNISEIFKGSEWEGVNVKKVLLNVKGMEAVSYTHLERGAPASGRCV